MGRTAVYALARAGRVAPSVDPGTFGHRHPRRCRLDRHHPFRHVGCQAGIRACITSFERIPRAERQDVRAPRRCARGVVLFVGRGQHDRRTGGPIGLPPALLQGSHEPRAAGSDHLLRVEAHRPSCGSRRVRGRLEGGREVGGSSAGFTRFLPDRAVLSLFCSWRQALSCQDLAPSLAPA